MKQIINITLGGRNIAIEDSAYQKIQDYINSLRQYFKNEEGRDEIVADIEARFAELMNDKIRRGAANITDSDVEEMIAAMGRPEDFDATVTGAENAQSGNTAFAFPEKRRLYRDVNNKILGGVCSGIANWLKIDPTIVRILFAIVSFGGFGVGILIYLILWIFLPARSMEVYSGKRMYRDSDNKWFGGVAGGMGAYFNINPNTIRWILALPLLFSILKGVNAFGWRHDFDFFPNLLFNGLTGTFIFIYIVLWIILPEAVTPYQKMEMRGKAIDVNTIKQNVQNSFGDINERLKNWGKEVQDSAEKLGQKATVRGKEFHYIPPRSNRGIGYVIAMIFKAFFVIIGGIIAVSLLAMFLTLLFSGIAWTPVNNFLWTSDTQQMLGWATLLLFIGAPIIGLVVWLARRVLNVNTPGNYLNWTFGGLWAIGWVCLMFFLASLSNDFKRYESVEETASIQQPQKGKLIVTVTEPELLFEGNFGWMNNDSHIEGVNFTEDTLKLATVSLDFEKSDDSFYHISIVKQAIGKTDADALSRARKINYKISSKDSVINLANSFSVDKQSKYRLQNVQVIVKVPVGKKININESVFDKLAHADLDLFDRKWRRNQRFSLNNVTNYRSNTDYTMQVDGSLKSDFDDSIVSTSKDTSSMGDNYRWNGNDVKDSITSPSIPPTPTAPSIDSPIYHYNESPSNNKSKEEMTKELKQKQKEIDELKKKLDQEPR